jgi:23S rRNA (cytosine1962-C5)-methyltransferase
VVDRPCLGAVEPKTADEWWSQADLSFQSEDDRWHYRDSFKQRLQSESTPWICQIDNIQLGIRPTSTGQLGLFPEHWAHWSWLRQQLHFESMPSSRVASVLNLFAYTGATTLALAAAGCEVTHVDASKPTIQWARDNATRSGLESAPIRWIVDDAAAYVRREIRRNKTYDAILLDPPSYGHGTQGNRWQIHRDLVPLLHDCWQLLSDRRCAVLLCGHSSHISFREVNSQLAARHGKQAVGNCEVTQAFLEDMHHRKLDCGFAARYSW